MKRWILRGLSVMAGNYYFKDRSGGQNGPVSFDELVALAKAGRLAPDCLVWPEAGEPAAARSFPGLGEAFGQSQAFATPTGQGPLVGDFPGWGLLWRAYVFALGLFSVVFAPLAGRWYYKFIASRVSLPNGRRLFVDSTLSSCWWMFLGLSLAILTPLVVMMSLLSGNPEALHGHNPAALQEQMAHLWPIRIAANIAAFVLNYIILRWFVGCLRSEDGALNIAFTGGFWGFIGWNLLIVFSVFTIIGWAWALAGFFRWMCRSTLGTHAFAFVGSGWQILWRSLASVFGLGLLGGLLGSAIGLSAQSGHGGGAAILALLGMAGFIYLLAQVMGWLANWFVSQIVVTPGAAEPARQQAA
jgi:hypothetical protein